MFPQDFIEYLQQGYFEPVPKKFFVLLLLLALYFGLSRFKVIQTAANQISRLPARRVLTGIFLLALFLRAGWCVLAPTEFPNDYNQEGTFSESALINIYGIQISKTGIPVETDGMLSTRRPIGYPYLLGALYTAFGYHPALFKIFQILTDSTVVVILFLLARTLFQNTSIGLITAFLYSIFPNSLMSVNIPLDEYPFFITWFSALYLAVNNLRKRQVKFTIAIGILLGLATAFRTTAFHTPLLIFCAGLTARLPLKKSLFQMILCFALIYLVSSPWAWVTYKHYGAPCFFSTGRANFYGTLNKDAPWHNGYIPATVEDGGDAAFLTEQNPVKRVPIGVTLAAQWVKENPAEAFSKFIMRNAFFFGFDMRNELSDLNQEHASRDSSLGKRFRHPIRKYKAWFYAFTILCGLLTIPIMLSDNRYKIKNIFPKISLLVLIFGYWAVMTGFFFGVRKYRWPLEIILILPAAFVLHWLFTRSSGIRYASNESNKQKML